MRYELVYAYTLYYDDVSIILYYTLGSSMHNIMHNTL